MSQSKIYVGNLSYNVANDDLQEYFSQYGEIAEVKLIADYEGRSKGFAFITFATPEAAQASLNANGVEWQGRKLKVNIAHDRQQGSGSGSGGGRGGRHQGSGGRKQY